MLQDKVLMVKFWALYLELKIESNLGVIKDQGQFLQMDPFVVLIVATLSG